MKLLSMMMMLGMFGSQVFGQQLTVDSGSNLQVNGLLTQNPLISSQNLVSNGDFSKCSCSAPRCAFNGNGMVENWSADSQFEIGQGYLYNDFLGYERVLAPSKGSCVKQQINYLNPGYYKLVVEYSARKDQQLSNCNFSVSMNGNLIKTISPVDYQVRSETIDIEVSNGCLPDLRICGAGVNDFSYGALIRSVKLLPNSNPIFQVKPVCIDIQPPTINVQTPTIYVPNIQAPSIPTVNFPTIQPPTVNIQSPTLNLPPIQTPTINVQTPTIYVPNIQAPNIPTINFPTVQPPVVNIPSPTLNIPTIQPPVVNIPDIQTGIINIPGPVFNYPTFNQPISSPPGIYIDSHSNQCYQKQYKFQGGDVEISFDFKVLSTLQLSQSALYVTIDNQQVYKVSPSDDGKKIKFIVPKVPAGQHVIGLVPYGCINEPLFTFFLSNFLVQQKICVAQWSNDLITNGGFENLACQGSYCIWNQQTFQSSFLPGWIPGNEIEVGSGTNYNSKLVNTKVVQLDSNANTCIKQKLNLKAGTYNLSFDWAARQGTSFATNGIQAKINGQVIKSVSATDYEIHSESAQFTLNADNANSELQFCGTGTSDSYGSLLDNVKLFYNDPCGSYKMNTC